MHTVKEILGILKMNEFLGIPLILPGKFDRRSLEEYPPTCSYTPPDRYVASSRKVVSVMYEEFKHPETGEILYRPVGQ